MIAEREKLDLDWLKTELIELRLLLLERADNRDIHRRVSMIRRVIERCGNGKELNRVNYLSYVLWRPTISYSQREGAVRMCSVWLQMLAADINKGVAK